MAEYRYLIFSGFSVWGKYELSKEYFIGAVQRDDLIVDLNEMKFFDKDDNEWKEIKGDKPIKDNKEKE